MSYLCPYCSGTVDRQGLSSHQQLLPSSTSHNPAAPVVSGRVKVAGHHTGGGTRVTFVLQTDAPGSSAYFRELFLFFSLQKRTRLTAVTHSLFLRLLCRSCFSQLQSQVILNNSPTALAHSNVIRALTSLTILLHIAFQMVNAFLPLEHISQLPQVPTMFVTAHEFIPVSL